MEHPNDPAEPHPEPRADRPFLGMVLMLVTGLCFVAVTATVKMVDDTVPAVQAAFLRYALGLILLVPMWSAVRSAQYDARLWKLLGARGVAHAIGVILWFFAMSRIPLADVTAMNYLNPVYVILLSVIFLGDRLGPWRIASIVVAFAGTLVIVRPGFREVDIGHIVMLFTAVMMAGSYFLAKLLTQRTSTPVVIFWLSVIITAILAPMAWAVWVPIAWVDVGWLFLTALFATSGHYVMTQAFRMAPLSVTQPVTFTQLIWATLLGVFVFGEPADLFVLLGGVMIIASATIVTWREAVRARADARASAHTGSGA